MSNEEEITYNVQFTYRENTYNIYFNSPAHYSEVKALMGSAMQAAANAAYESLINNDAGNVKLQKVIKRTETTEM